MYDKMKNTLEI